MIALKDYKNFASKDETRYDLKNIHIIDNKAYITDGYRMLIFECSKPNGQYNMNFEKFGGLEPRESMTKVVPTKEGYKAYSAKVPEMFKMLKTTIKSIKLIVYLDIEGKFHFEKPDNFLIALNPIFLRELAGYDLTLLIKNDLSHIIIELDEQQVIIMPKRT